MTLAKSTSSGLRTLLSSEVRHQLAILEGLVRKPLTLGTCAATLSATCSNTFMDQI